MKENIAAFGGDPDNVTLMGGTGGAMCIMLLAVSERAKGLFNRAVLLSGTVRDLNDAAEKASEETAARFAELFEAKSMADLVSIPEKELAVCVNKGWWIDCGPRRDGRLLPADIEQAYADGKAAGVRFLFGEAKNELGIYRSVISGEEYDEWLAGALETLFEMPGEEITALKAFFAEKEKALGTQRARELTVERWAFRGGMLSLLEKLRNNGSEGYVFRFEPEAEIEKLGSGSLLMLATVLDNGQAAEEYGSLVNKNTVLILQALLMKFLRDEPLTLNNNEIKGVNAIDWQPYPAFMRVTDTAFACGTDVRNEE